MNIKWLRKYCFLLAYWMLSRINETSDFDRLDETIKYEWKREFCIEKKNEKRFEFKV